MGFDLIPPLVLIPSSNFVIIRRQDKLELNAVIFF